MIHGRDLKARQARSGSFPKPRFTIESQGLAGGLESQPCIPSSSTVQDSRNAVRAEVCQSERDSPFPDIWFADGFEPHRFPIRFESDQTESRAGIQLLEFAG